MDRLYSFLLEWTINYVKHRDILKKTIKDIEKNKQGFDLIVNFKDKKQYFIIKPFINNINRIIDRINKEDHFSLIIFNTEENFKFIVDNWNILTEFKDLNIYFVNPFSNLDKKWIIYPHTHNKICDNVSLESGLKAMFETVESISEQQLNKKISK